MKLTDRKLNLVWSYVFGMTMRERAKIPGSAEYSSQSRLDVAVAAADDVCSSEKAALAWYRDVEKEWDE